MKVPSFLCVILFTASLVSGYTVVLSNGKFVQGTLIGEDSLTIQIRDGNGTFLSIGRHLIDSRSTHLANEPFVLPDQPAPATPSGPRNLVELAEMCKRNRTGNVLSLRDIGFSGSSDVSILGGNEEPGIARELPRDSSSIPSREEQHWRREARSIRNDVRRLRERRIAAEESCARSQSKVDTLLRTPARKPVDLLSAMDETSECRRAREIEHQLSEEELRWSDFEERARRSGVPFSWLE